MKKIIPIMFCFDTNYVIPASVAFYSLLEHANKDYYYKFYILSSDITKDQKRKLKKTLEPFKKYYDITYVDMKNKFDDIWTNIKSKIHFSKEMIYKLIVASMFPEYEKIIVTDVDVVFLGDVSKSYFSFDAADDIYVAGVKPIGVLKQFNNVYDNKFDESMIEKFNNLCAGYLVFNLKKMREDNIEEKFISFLRENTDKLIFPEQDALNAICYGKVKYLPLNNVTCTYMWNLYGSEYEFEHDGVYTAKELNNAMNHPIQLHYASTEKPWKYVDCVKSEIWFEYIVKTAFLKDYLKWLPNHIVINNNNVNNAQEKANEEIKQVKNSNIRKGLRYIKNNPLFFIKPHFYKRLFKTLLKK